MQQLLLGRSAPLSGCIDVNRGIRPARQASSVTSALAGALTMLLLLCKWMLFTVCAMGRGVWKYYQVNELIALIGHVDILVQFHERGVSRQMDEMCVWPMSSLH